MLLYSNHPKMLIVLLLFVCPSETTLAAATAASTTSTNYCPQVVTATRQCQSSSSSSSSSSSMITHNVLAMTRGGSTEEEEEEGDAVVTDTNNTKQMDDDDENEATKTTEDADNNLTVQATQLRLEGKEYHDQGEFASAAKLFGEAADLWLVGRRGNNIHDDAAAAAAAAAQAEEYATCRLHQSLCCLKSQEYQGCVEACTSVLGDEEENNDDEASSSSSSYTSNPVLRARAYHRRSKAKLGLGDSTGALRDARSAAFLGDRKAVAFYGRLMRESSSSSSSGSTSGSSGMGGDVDSLASLLSSSSSSPNAALLESLLNKSNNNNNNATPSSFGGLDPTSLLMGSGTNSFLAKALGGGKGKKGDESGGLAKSLLSSLVKRLEEDSTQTLISNTLQNTNPAQLQSLVGMAGMEIPEQHLDRMVGVCHKVTPKTIQRTLKMGRRVVYVGKVGRKISKILQKYKSLIVAVCIWKWTKSAYCRPIPMDRKAAKRASKLALKQALKDNRKNGPAAAAAAAAAGGGRAAL